MQSSTETIIAGQVLTEAQIESYYREGYIVIPALVPRPAIARVMDAARTVTVADDATAWKPVIFEHAEPDRNAPIHALLIEPHIVGAVEQIFEAPARVWYGMLAIVPAHGGNGLPWHQDNMYTTVLGRAINAFIALSEITPDAAILWVAPRSHRRGIQESATNDTTAKGHREATIAPSNGIPLPTMQPGDVCLFDRNTLHRSLTNTTGAHRYAYAAQYMEEKARMAETGKRDPLRMRVSELSERWA